MLMRRMYSSPHDSTSGIPPPRLHDSDTVASCTRSRLLAPSRRASLHTRGRGGCGGGQRASARSTSLVDFVLHFRSFGVSIAPWQVVSELRGFLSRAAEARPAAVLEIGTAAGGTFFGLAHVAEPDALLVSVDLPGGEFGGGYPWSRASLPQIRQAAATHRAHPRGFTCVRDC